MPCKSKANWEARSMVSSSPDTSPSASAARLALVPATPPTPVAATVVVQLPSASSSHRPPRGQSRIAWVRVRVGTVLGCESGEWATCGINPTRSGMALWPCRVRRLLTSRPGSPVARRRCSDGLMDAAQLSTGICKPPRGMPAWASQRRIGWPSCPWRPVRDGLLASRVEVEASSSRTRSTSTSAGRSVSWWVDTFCFGRSLRRASTPRFRGTSTWQALQYMARVNPKGR